MKMIENNKENDDQFNTKFFITSIIFGFILWIIFEKLLNNTVNKNNKYILPNGPSFFKWFKNYLFNYYDLKTPTTTTTTTTTGAEESLIENTSENTVLKWFNELNNDNYCVSFFGRPMIFTRDINISKYVLSSNNIDNYTKPPDESGVLIRLANNSILMSEGDQWRYHRSIITQPFSSKNVKLMIPTIINTVNNLINNIINHNNQHQTISIDIHNYCTKLTFDIIGKLSIGYDFKSISTTTDTDTTESNDISKQFDFILNEMIRPIRRFSSYIPLYNDFKLFKYLNKFETIIKNAIKARPTTKEDNDDSIYKNNYLLDNLINDKVKEKDIIGNINTFLLAGHETSANLLTFIFYLLSTHKDIQNELYNQLLSKKEQNENNDFQSVELVDWIIYETLRLFPPAPMIGRTSKFDDELITTTTTSSTESTSFKIPKETLILISVYAIHRDPKLWKNPNSFNPYRWKNLENINNRSDFIPFSSGGRVCVGQKFSIVEARIIISNLILNFDIEFDKNQKHPFTIYQRATLTPKYPVYLILKKR